jgi:hypothetical protein
MKRISSVCVYAGSRPGRQPAFMHAAKALGRGLAERGISLVYGGGNVGMMGVMADAALAAGGRVVGVIPRFLEEREVRRTDLSEQHTVGSMHERKAKIKVKTPVVDIDGDEMTRIIWKLIKDKLILPYLDIDLKYYDLGIEHRDATDDQVTIDAARRSSHLRRRRQVRDDHARRGAREGIQPQGDVEVAERHDPQHPRRHVFREPIVCKNVPRLVPGWTQPDRHRPPRLRRPVSRHRFRRARQGQAHDDLHADGASPSRTKSSRSRAAASRWRCTISTTRSATSRALHELRAAAQLAALPLDQEHDPQGL